MKDLQLIKIILLSILWINFIIAENIEIDNDTSVMKIQKIDKSISKPDIFSTKKYNKCDINPIVSAWCDINILSELNCGILNEFDEYGCDCYNDPSLCPTECINGNEPIQRLHYGIRCSNIPSIENIPNYILKERHNINDIGHCENNLLINSWCDTYINKHLQCNIYNNDNQYLCTCTGKATNCPDECIDGSVPLIRTKNSVLCNNIPIDNPNYVMK